ncbi:MAG: hypothetical protein IRZ21_06970 [Thermoleophilaceae bacterium]|nr:hypothetical protein [Thermoleophilaceae bacterium]
MSWELGSALVLGAALAAGFGWYERSRPQAKVLALVASLAALAVVGRIAFAALPNVKPTTDVVLFSGFALGGAPGFAVGATAALVSNLFFGQGPWTPWQMAAWGAVGVGGAALARATGGRVPGRFALAAACALAGLAFGALMDLYQWTLAARQDAATYAAISGTSLAYNIAHAAGNAVFAVLLGPAFVRSLRRYRRRLEVRWAAPAGAAACLVLALAAALGGEAAPGAGAAVPAPKRAVGYLERAQNADGGFGPAPRAGSSQLYTGWAGLGLAAGGVNPAGVRRGKRSALDFTARPARALNDAGELERTILLVRAAGRSPRRFARRDLVRELVSRRHPNGSIGNLVNQTAFEVLALRAGGVAAGSPLVRSAARWIERQQSPDGGFGFAERGGTSDVDDTGAVLQALAAARRGRATIAKAVRYLARVQNADGGFGQMRGRPSNAQSTAWAVQGLVAVGRDPGRFRRGGRTPLGYLRSLQGGNGMVRYSRTSAQSPVWVTAQALMALARKPLPLAPVPQRRKARLAGSESPPSAASAKRPPAAPPRARARARRAERPGGPPATLHKPLGPPERSPAPAPQRRASSSSGGRGDPSAPAIGGAALGAAGLAAAGWLGLRRRRRAGGAAA